MATDTDDLFRALAEDASRTRLDAPADLRRRSDRRTAVRTALGTVAVVAVVAAVLVGGGALQGDSTRDLAPVEPASPTVTVSKSPAAPVTSIPAAAWLDQDDLRSGEPMARGDLANLPALCGQRLLPPGFEPASMTAVGVRDGTYLAPGLPADFVPNGTISQAIAVFGDEEGAARLMQRVEQAVTVCPEDAETDLRYDVADPALPLSSARPDQHLLIDVDEPGIDFGDGAPNPPRIGTYISVRPGAGHGDAVDPARLGRQ